MPYRRIAAAAAVLLAVIYLKLCIPAFAVKVVPALREVMDTEQVVLPVNEEWMEKLGLN